MRWVVLWLLAVFSAGGALADGEKAGQFDYYVLSLSWSPNWCLREGNARNSPQCTAGRRFGWVLHGLWPQYARGYPSWCRTVERAPSRAMTESMADVMGTSGLAWHQWKKHGVCSGLSAADYYALSREAFDLVKVPEVFARLDKPVQLPAAVVEEAFLKANPGWRKDMLTITCKQGQIEEARLCLTKALNPVVCGADVVRDCTLRDAAFAPVK
ncbi:MAG: ribonuclease T2 [Pseudooceanicola sp.]|nr:ribonuclease T2 [Pseudooceanicola sp.]